VSIRSHWLRTIHEAVNQPTERVVFPPAGWIRAASFLPPFSPFVMLARVVVGRASALEIAVSAAILVGTIILVGLVAVRIYATGVILYGLRPSMRDFVAAARRRT
jgi:ABC-2 type transport system permease protein